MAYKPIFDASNATPFKFEAVGDQLEAHYMGSFFQGDYGPTQRHVFSSSAGALNVIGQRNLMQQLPSVRPGTKVRITFTESLTMKKGRAPMKKFLVEEDTSDTIAVHGVNFTPTENFSPSDDQDDPTSEDTGITYAALVANTVVPTGQANAARQAETLAILNKAKTKTT